jgi:uncharacterized protein YkwD
MRLCGTHRVALLAGLAAVAALVLPGTARSAPATQLADLESALVAQVNDLREARGLRPLVVSRGLAAAAVRHASAMGSLGFFAHESANGASFAARIARFYPRRTKAWTVGENLCFGDPGVSAADCLDTWLSSPAHRRNLFDPNWREIGVAALDVTAAPGEFGGLDTTIVVADFGARA